MAVTKVTRKSKGTGKKTVIFMADVWVNGVKVATECFETQTAAHNWHDKTKTSWLEGKVASEEADFTFGDCLAAYLDSKQGFKRLRLSSQQSMEARLDHFSKAPIAKVRMADFGPATVDAWLAWVLDQPTAQNPGRKSFKIELKYLSVLLSWYRDFMNPNFVVPIVKRHRKQAFYKPVKPRRKDYFIREEHIIPWINWLRENREDPVFYRLATFMVLTGTRIGEACGLCWNEVDLEHEEVHITRTMSWDHWTRRPYLVDVVKTEESDRIVHLPKTLSEMLAQIKLGSQAKDAPVFLNRKGEFMRDAAVRRSFTKGFEALGLSWSGSHICRHTLGTLGLKANGGNLSKVQAELGQSDRKTTERYAKAIACQDKSTVESAAKLMGFHQTDSATQNLFPKDHLQNHLQI